MSAINQIASLWMEATTRTLHRSALGATASLRRRPRGNRASIG